MTMIENFVKERNEALFSLDRRKIEAYLVKYGEGETAKAPDLLFWASVYSKTACSRRSNYEQLNIHRKRANRQISWIQRRVCFHLFKKRVYKNE